MLDNNSSNSKTERDSIQFLEAFFGKDVKNKTKKNNEINIHSECISKIDNIYDELLEEKNKYNSLYNINKKFVNEIKELKTQNEKLQLQFNELSKWKDNHRCDNINIDNVEQELYDKIYNDVKQDILEEVKNSNDINLDGIKINVREELKKEYENNIFILNSTITKLNEDITFLKSDKNNKDISIEYNNLINIEKQVNDALNNQKEFLTKEFKKEKDIINLDFNKKFVGLQNTIENLQSQLNNNKKNIKKNNEKTVKYSIEDLYNSIIIYDNINSDWQKYYASITFNKINIINNLDIKIKRDEKVDKESYFEVSEWINKNEKINYTSNYFKIKHERCLYILEKYKNKLDCLKCIKFSPSYITNMNKSQWKKWLEIFDNKINNLYNILEDNIGNNKIDICLECKKLEMDGLKGLCERHFEELQNNVSDTDDDS